MLCCDISPEGKRCRIIRLTQRTEEYVQLHESGHMTDRFATGISYVTWPVFLQRQQALCRGDAAYDRVAPLQGHFYRQHGKRAENTLPCKQYRQKRKFLVNLR